MSILQKILTLIIALSSFVLPQSIIIKEQFSKELFEKHIRYLGSDSLEGRAPGTRGGNLAAKYLANEFSKLNLVPIDKVNQYYQFIPFHGSKPLINSKLNIKFASESIGFRLKEDFLMYQTSNPVFIPNETPIVFVGYGIIANEFDYNDYYDIDVEGKIVLFLDGEPLSTDPDYFNGSFSSIYSSPEAKQRVALSRGAKGSILIPSNSETAIFNWQKVIQDFSFENLSLASSPSTSFDIMINPEIADLLFTDSGFTLEDIYRMQKENRLKSFSLSGVLTFQGSFRQRDFVSPNVVGIIEGDDASYKDSYVLVTAHYDHLGIGPTVKGDSIYNGVFDNAAGVSALLEIARALSDSSFYNRRSIIFVLLTAEEYGLLGSEYYVNNPVKPLYKTIANINIDGVASFDNFKSYVAVGSEFSTLINFIKNAADIRKLRSTEIPTEFYSENAFTKSDQFSFAKAGIPSALLTEGTDYINTSKSDGIKKMIDFANTIYHFPSDDLSLPINFNAVIQHIDFIFGVIDELANSETEPVWNVDSPFRYARVLSQRRLK
ncbi:MAG: M28 family peptidase [Melioribacteraceae bacterium]